MPFEAHAWHFGETIEAALGVLVTRIAPDVTRLGSTAVDTVRLAELHGLRAVPGGFALVGRVRSERRPDGGGWNTWVASVGADGSGGTVRVLDVDRGDVLFDLAALADGASISETCVPLVLRLAADSTLREPIAFAGGPRQNPLRALLRHGNRWLVAGLRDGPGHALGRRRPGADPRAGPGGTARRAALTTLKARARPPSRARRGAPVRLIRPAHSAPPAAPAPGHPPRA